ncbi:MAG TPA: Trm112 family protein [Chloroflexota bacterium]|nr:Trm112 family protein [Chloroflexota bacterium]
MKRLLLLLLAAGGAALWWKNRGGGGSDESAWSQSESAGAGDVAPDPPKLGGDVDAELLAILACPLDKQPVTRQGNYLVCQVCQRHYPIREGIPVMLIDEALTPEQAASATA